MKPKGRGKIPKAVKKGQVVHVCDWLLNYFRPVAEPYYWAAGDKRDDVADCFLQVLSFLNVHIGPKLKRERRGKGREVKSFAQKRGEYNARVAKYTKTTGTTNNEDDEEDDEDMFHDSENEKDDGDDDDDVPYMVAGLSSNHTSTDKRTPDLRTKYKPHRCTTLGISRGLHTFPEGNHYVYLLASVSPQSTYIGYTNAPLRRFLQHCQVYAGGAKCTKRSTTWEPALIVSGFSAKDFALSFESTWQRFRARRVFLQKKKVMKETKKKKEVVAITRKHRTLPTKLRSLAGAIRNPRFVSMPNLRVHWLWSDNVADQTFPTAVVSRLI